MSNLILDIGNTFAKVAVFQQDNIVAWWRVERDSLVEKINSVLSENQIRKAIICNVSVVIPELESVFKAQQIDFIHLSATTPLPFRNLYATPRTLGKDRIALAAAAVGYYPARNVLVIDAGSCVTYEIINDQNEYLGGVISPGLKMRFAAMHSFTAGLPDLRDQPFDDLPLIGDDTKTGMQIGAAEGLAREIDGFIDDYKKKYSDLTVIFTGGDHEILSKRLKNSIFAAPNFLAKGLNYILEFNLNK